MSKAVEVELAQLKTSINYLVGLLEEGSLVERFDKSTREEIAFVLQLLLSKVKDLPSNIPEHLVQATAVRAIIGASEKFTKVEQADEEEHIARNMREIEAAASIQGHDLGEWEEVAGSAIEYQATCRQCGGFVYVNQVSAYNLLTDDCVRVQM